MAAYALIDAIMEPPDVCQVGSQIARKPFQYSIRYFAISKSLKGTRSAFGVVQSLWNSAGRLVDFKTISVSYTQFQDKILRSNVLSDTEAILMSIG